VENRGGIVTAEVASRAVPDGYTISLNGANLWVTTLLRKSSYDVLRDFAPISLLLREVAIVAVNPSVPVNSVKELIALAKAKPGELNFASDAPGGTSNLSGQLFKSMAGVNIVNVPYKGNAAGITALVAGEVQLIIVDSGLLMPHVKSGKLRALAVTSAQPTALTPGLPTVAAAGLPGYESVGMTGMLAPAKTPVVIIKRLNHEIVRVATREDVKEKFFSRGSEVVGSTPAEYLAVIKADIARKGKIIKDAGIKVD
jgi:tripartite-type tricarboxylate transporter receptor subunit TctC